jgi:hypothetical protein
LGVIDEASPKHDTVGLWVARGNRLGKVSLPILDRGRVGAGFVARAGLGDARRDDDALKKRAAG